MARRSIKPEDLYDLTAVGDPRVSPDGTRVAYVRQTLDRDENEARTEIWVVDVGGGEPRRLTGGKKDRDPRWAPDGHRIAFISDRTGKKQIHVLDTRGGEAWHVSTEQAVESPPAWSPDGTMIAFVSRVMDRDADWQPYAGCPPHDRERADAAARAALESGAKDRDGKGDQNHLSGVKVITDAVYRFDGMGFFGDLNRHVFAVELPPGPDGTEPAVKKLTSGPFNHGDPTWSPDGRLVAVTALRREPGYDDLFRMDIWRVEVATGEMEQVVDGRGPAGALSWSPCGRHLAYIGHHGEHGRSTSPGLWMVPMDHRGPHPLTAEDLVCLTRDLDRPAGFGIPSDIRFAAGAGLDWDPGGERIYFLVGDRGSTWIYESRAGDGWSTPEPVAGDETGAIVFLSAGPDGVLAYMRGRADAPDQIFARGSGGEERQLTRENAGLLEQVHISSPRHIQYQGPDGWDMDGWLYCPPGMERDERVPLVLMIHGGPHGAYGYGFTFLTQVLCGSGFGVLMLNPRGSQTYGQEFASAVVGDWGGKDYGDLMAGVDHVIEMGLADPERLGVTGWSYGGYMTNWVTGQTGRFRAAVTGACVFNHVNFYGTSDIGPTFGEFQWGGNPWDDPELLLERSPLKYVGEVETPVLILHGEADLRCPVEQAEQLFAALKRQGKTGVMVRYPGEFHGLSKPAHRVDRCGRTIAWFEHYLG